MSDEQRKQPTAADELIRRLVKETGITEAQARELVLFLGYNWSSLVREARMLKEP
ncbi:hypothetical protein [Mesorhizobium huakuii]|uniref:DUF3606 domain-containing protein n=1 Tax=Mesorhizobium huakuii TaxID=28104 RepID=A0A7G6SZC8_9HYPH|nr:hypothetical protein [Mesorhizobium huakuii]QND59860.1 hypothetical protein HB778_27360 [Mesorhizobium huakuii]